MTNWPKASLPRVLGIVLLGLGTGLVGNQVSPRGLPLVAPPRQAEKAGVAYLALDQARQWWQAGNAFFLDAREPADFAAGHIGNALNLPAQSFARHFGEVAPLLSRETPLVLYCDGTECDLSHRLRDSLRQLGYTNTHLLFNGWTAWRLARLPTSGEGQK
jgi:rhodanese-related sulfurtransferase